MPPRPPPFFAPPQVQEVSFVNATAHLVVLKAGEDDRALGRWSEGKAIERGGCTWAGGWKALRVATRPWEGGRKA